MSNFDELEERLKRDMERAPAPDGFADRVMERVATEGSKDRLLTMPTRRAWMAVAAMLLVGIVLGGWQWRQHELRKEREEAALVQRQFDMAMHVTQRTLVEVQMQVGKTVRESVRP